MRSSRKAGVDSRHTTKYASDRHSFSTFSGLVVLRAVERLGQWKHRAMHPPDGQIAQQELCRLTLARSHSLAWPVDVDAGAHYDITARVLGNESYRFDALAALVPEDLALGWGPNVGHRVINTLDMSQSARILFVAAACRRLSH